MLQAKDGQNKSQINRKLSSDVVGTTIEPLPKTEPTPSTTKGSFMQRALQQAQKPDQEKEVKAATEVPESKPMTEEEIEFQKAWTSDSPEKQNQTVQVESKAQEEKKTEFIRNTEVPKKVIR